MALFQINSIDINTTPPAQALIPLTEIFFDSNTQKIGSSSTPIDPSDFSNKEYVDSVGSNCESFLGANLSPINVTNNSTDLQSFILPANLLTQAGSSVTYSLKVKMAVNDVLNFVLGASILDTYVALTLSSTGWRDVQLTLLYVDSTTLNWSLKILSENQNYINEGSISNYAWDNSATVLAIGNDASLTGTMISQNAILTKIGK